MVHAILYVVCEAWQKIYGRFVSSSNKNDHQNKTLIIVMETLNIQNHCQLLFCSHHQMVWETLIGTKRPKHAQQSRKMDMLRNIGYNQYAFYFTDQLLSH